MDLNDDRKNYIYIYAGLITLFAVLVQLRGTLFYGWSLAASTVIHNRTILIDDASMCLVFGWGGIGEYISARL